jgi:hypothetical protein
MKLVPTSNCCKGSRSVQILLAIFFCRFAPNRLSSIASDRLSCSWVVRLGTLAGLAAMPNNVAPFQNRMPQAGRSSLFRLRHTAQRNGNFAASQNQSGNIRQERAQFLCRFAPKPLEHIAKAKLFCTRDVQLGAQAGLAAFRTTD